MASHDLESQKQAQVRHGEYTCLGCGGGGAVTVFGQAWTCSYCFGAGRVTMEQLAQFSPEAVEDAAERRWELRRVDSDPLKLTGLTIDHLAPVLRISNLAWADLREADAAGAVLAGANLCGGRLAGAYLDHVNLRGACLTDADLMRVDLSNAMLDEADLRGANPYAAASLKGASMRGIQDSMTARQRAKCVDLGAVFG